MEKAGNSLISSKTIVVSVRLFSEPY